MDHNPGTYDLNDPEDVSEAIADLITWRDGCIAAVVKEHLHRATSKNQHPEFTKFLAAAVCELAARGYAATNGNFSAEGLCDTLRIWNRAQRLTVIKYAEPKMAGAMRSHYAAMFNGYELGRIHAH